MSSINPNQLNAMAQEVYNLLDAKETADGVNNGKDKLGDSIWNKFVGPDENGKNQVGNGEKSKIEKEIPFQNAISSIASYIKNKGTAAIQEALKRIGIEWKPSVDVEANSTSNTQNTDASTNDKNLKALQKKVKANKKGIEAYKAEQKKYDDIEKQKNTVSTKVKINGEEKTMTYKEITRQLYSFKQRFALLGVVYDDPNGAPRSPRLSDIHQHLKNSIATGRGNANYRQNLQELESLLAAKHELEEKYPDFKNVTYVTFIGEDGHNTYVSTEHSKNVDFIDE